MRGEGFYDNPCKDEARFRQAVLASSSAAEVRRRLGLKSGSAHATIVKYAAIYGIDLPRDPLAQAQGSSRAREIDTARIFCENSSFTNTRRIKRILIDTGVLKEQCSECGILPTWNGKPLTLQLEHINGINSDNRVENLTLLCPNCHSQTSTYAGRNSKGASKRVVYPEDEIFLQLLSDLGTKRVAEHFGVVPSTIRHKYRKIRLSRAFEGRAK